MEFGGQQSPKYFRGKVVRNLGPTAVHFNLIQIMRLLRREMFGQ